MQDNGTGSLLATGNRMCSKRRSLAATGLHYKNLQLRPRRVILYSRPFSQPLIFPFVMSQHRSLKGASSVGSKRSVLKRGERIKLLKSRGLWKEGRLPTGLPKTKSE